MNVTRILMALITILGMICSAHGEQIPPTETSKSAESIPAQPQSGGRLTESILGDITNLIPQLSSDSASHTVADLIYVAPLRYDRNIELEVWAAESFEVLDDGKLLRFKLREDIRWFDGHPLTAEDVEFTYKMMVDPETPTAYAGDYKMVKEFRLTGPHSFEVTYEEPFARALVTWAHAILPKHVLEGKDLLSTKYLREPLGAGPYKLKEWVPGTRVVLEANDDYFEGKPYIDEVVYRIIPDQATQFLELKAGNLDMMNLTPLDYVYQTDGQFWKDNFHKYEYLSSGYTYLGYNQNSTYFQDVKVRQAFAHAIDKEELVKGVLAGLGVPATGPYKPGTWAYDENVVPYEYDPVRAVELLAEAGWTDSDEDGILDREGIPFSFTILTNQGNTQRIKTAVIIQYRLAQIGIRAEIRTVEWASFLKEFIDKRRYDALIMGWNITADPDLYDVWHSVNAYPGGLNFIDYVNPELDRLLEEGRSTLDQSHRKVVYDQVQEILHRDQPYCFLYVPMSLPIVQARIQGIEPAPAGIGYNFTDWWIPRGLQKMSISTKSEK